ncbi:MAG: hypothetical protein ABJB10_12920 [Mesorhizobium sp.]
MNLQRNSLHEEQQVHMCKRNLATPCIKSSESAQMVVWSRHDFSTNGPSWTDALKAKSAGILREEIAVWVNEGGAGGEPA